MPEDRPLRTNSNSLTLPTVRKNIPSHSIKGTQECWRISYSTLRCSPSG